MVKRIERKTDLMTTNNVLMYHCQHCGKVARQFAEMQAPWCCGQPMPIAATETVEEARHERPEEGREGKIPAARPEPAARSS